nr:P-selectin-like isoform X1 [Pogona vitticeps]
MGVTSRRFRDCILLFAIISWGFLFLVDVHAWTYHYGDKSQLTWEKARTFCQTSFTDLVAIQNKKEIEYLNAVLPYHPNYYWIGIRKINNTWTWVGTGKILTKEAENWAVKEPNNKGMNQDCVEIYIKRNKEAGKWNDERCTKMKRALCYQASCHPSSCNERSECVETIGNYTCQCYPGFFGPRCEHVAKCRDLDAVHGPLVLNCSHPLGKFSYRSNCGFSCDYGFQLSGPATLQCLPSGNWTAETPQCIAVQCKPLNFPTHGNFSCSHIHGEFQYQSSCKFTCAEGFQISGADTTVCEKSGQWSSLEPTCQVRECQRIESPARGTINCINPIGDFAYNSTCYFSCEPGFELLGSKTLSCNASGQWTSSTPVCHAVQCQRLLAPAHGNSTCFHLHGEFQYQSNCTFHCTDGFLLIGEEVTQCTSQGEWTAPVPFCQAIDCPKLDAPRNGELNCSHPYGNFAYTSSCAFSCRKGFVQVGAEQLQCTALGIWTEKAPFCEAMQCQGLRSPKEGRMICSHPAGEFAYQSSCEFACEPGFALVGTKATHCLATGNWSAPLPTCQVIECSKLDAPKNGGINCSHPYGDFAYSSSCAFVCHQGFVQVGAEQLHCTSLGLWTERPPFCKAARCPALHKPDNGHYSCFHPHANFAYGSSCNFSCNVGFQLLGLELLECSALGNWTEQPPHCEAVQCPGLEILDNGKANCSHPHGLFAYSSSCIFSCNSGFELAGSEKLKCTEQGNWKGEIPTCEAAQCLTLRAPANGQLNCSHPFGTFRYNSSCMFSCDTGFVRVGAEMLNCTARGEWSGLAPSCEAIKCSQLQNMESMQIDCFDPWGSFSYKSACHFRCAEGYILNGTNRAECQPNGQWSEDMPVCQATAAPYFKQVLLYTGGAAASIIALVFFGGLIALAIKRFSKREERRKLLSNTSDIGTPGVFLNAAFDSVS